MNSNNLLLALIAILSVTGVTFFNQESAASSEEYHLFQRYQAWKSQYNINYNGPEDDFRFQIFQNNVKFIDQVNAEAKGENDQRLAVNANAGWDVEEYSQRLLQLNRAKKPDSLVVENNVTPAAQNININWDQKGAVLPTTNQANCGACWAFSAIGAMQGLRFITDGVLERLSAQQLVSCIPDKDLDPGAVNGCGGSEPFYAYDYTNKAGIETWENYPYVSGLEGDVPPCHHKKSDSVYFNNGPNQGNTVLRNDLPAMKAQIQKQVLAVEVAAGNVFFQFHKSGILTNKKCGAKLDHGIIAYGLYDVEGEQPYWMVQNSWGPDRWGINGYGKIAVTEGDGVCGINKVVTYPTTANYP